MHRFSLLFVIVGCVALAALLTWIALSSAQFGGRPSKAVRGAPIGGESVVREVPPFTRIDVTGSAEVTLVQGAGESITLPATLPRKSHVDATVRDGTLYIDANDGLRWWDLLLGSGGRAAPVVVAFRNLDSITTAGGVRLSAGTIKVPALRISGAGGTQVNIDDLAADQLRVAGAGALKAEIAGKADRLHVSISGAGEYHSAHLVAQDATVTVAGAGKVLVNAQKTLKVTISGAGSVEYVGDPEVTRSVSGAGSVRRREGPRAGIAAVAAVQ
ncbi:MAG: head GIN domain-containing protein [Burkholderiales bacterium]